jgi:hypothetical protein
LPRFFLALLVLSKAWTGTQYRRKHGRILPKNSILVMIVKLTFVCSRLF